jgi:hypothetical protein
MAGQRMTLSCFYIHRLQGVGYALKLANIN